MNFFITIINFLKRLFKKNEENENISGNIETNPINISNEQMENENETQNLGHENAQQENDCNIVILIDNGHGNNTPGKKSPYSCYGVKPEIEFYEYKWNREIANEIYSNLKKLGYDARLLVPEITDISLKERVNRANKVCNEVGTSNVILLSVHANAAGNGKEWKTAKGWCAFTTKGKTKSDAFAEYLYDEAEKNFVGHQIRTDKSDGDRDLESDFYIIHKTYCPAVLTENFFYDNVDDVQYILSDEGRDAVIKTHVDGIINYLKSIK